MIRVEYCVLFMVLLVIAEADRKDADYWITRFNMSTARDGGYYNQFYVSSEIISDLPERYGEGAERTFGSHMYALLKRGETNIFHRMKLDEIWHHYKGTTLTVFIIDQFTGKLSKVHLGPAVGRFALTINHGDWFGAKLRNDRERSYCLFGVSCFPGFNFADYEKGDTEKLIELYPQHENIIRELNTSE